MDEIMNQAAKMRYMFGGKAVLPMVIRAATGATVRGAAQHSQSIEAMFTHIPGLKVVMPATPADAKGLLTASIRDNNPVIFMEHKALYSMKGDVPEGEYTVPLGSANVAKEGTDVTIVAWSLMTQVALAAAKQLEEEGVSAEVVDIRSLVPLDKETIFDSVRKTHKLAIVQEAVHTSGIASEIAALVAENCLEELDENIARITAPDCPIPYSPVLEDEYVPSPQKVMDKIREIV
jgi:pyruvate dehydrogenase E1 component beta subunit